jgi:hypothetical protein
MNNRWHETLGCEVSVCQTLICNAKRMKHCALRKYYLNRIATLNREIEQAPSEDARQVYVKILDKLEGNDD